jgi:protein SCO1/2/putative membrane protein
LNASYKLGLRIVVATVAVAAFLSLLVPPPRPPARASEALEGMFPPLPAFELTERSGRPFGSKDLANEVWIAGFIFTRCQASCPRISATMKSVQADLEESAAGVKLVSLTVDPEHDTPEILSKYADTFGATPGRWFFLTGPHDTLFTLIRDGFRLAVGAADPSDPNYSLMSISHSSKLALVDRGNRVVGLYDADNHDEIARLLDRARKLERDQGWVRRLPAVNAGLNAVSTVLLLAAWLAILARYWRTHIGLMAAALVVSAAFLACYLVYHSKIGGGTPFPGQGGLRWAYFTVLISHVVLAAAVVPLIVMAVVRGIRRQWERHARIAAVTLPVWLYVSVTGVVVYVMLYQLPHATGGS